jgi:hypothetical protein
MADVLESIYKYLSLNAYISAAAGDRIYPELMPQQAALPAIVYSQINCRYDSALQKDTGFSRLTVQFNSYDETFGKAKKLGRIVKKAFQDYKGNMYGTDIQAVFIRSDFITMSRLKLNFDTEKYVSVIEIECYYTEEI